MHPVIRLLPALILRMVVIAAFAFGALLATNAWQRRWLPSATSFDIAFDRLGTAVAVAIVAALTVGGVLAWRGACRFGIGQSIALSAVALLLPVAVALAASAA